MTDIQERYTPLLKQIAARYADDESLGAQLAATTVVREVWDDNRSGGQFYMEVLPSADPVPHDAVDARAHDDDGAYVDIILHTVDGYMNWGEWFRYDHSPVVHWPPESLEMP
jgi:hypothetical protein